MKITKKITLALKVALGKNWRQRVREKDFSGAYFSRADFSEADFRRADFSEADFSGADFSGAYFSRADFSEADFSGANFGGADFSGANFSVADFRRADFSGANFSGAEGIVSAIDYLAGHFEKCGDGYIAYKTFNKHYKTSEDWKIEAGSVLGEVVNFTRTSDCGCGINVATKEWILRETSAKETIWKVLIRWEWLAGVCVPMLTDGKIRCERVELVSVMGRVDLERV